MKMAMHSAAVLGAALAAALVLSGCPAQPTYPSTITPIYAATSANGLYVYSGSTWTNYTGATANFVSGALSSVVVSGSGTNAQVFVGSAGSGISAFNGSTWIKWTSPGSGLGSDTINRLLIGSTVYAATASGLSAYNTDGSTPAWTNDTGSTHTFTTVDDVFVYGSYTYIAAATNGLIIDSGTGSEAQVTIPTLAAAGVLPGTTSVTAVFVDASGDVIVGTNAGLAVQYAGSSSWSPLVSVSIVQLTMDAFGNLYAAAGSNGVYVYSASSSGAYTLSAHLLSGTTVNCVAVDGADTIYAGTAAGLLISMDGGSTWATQLSGKDVTAVTTTAPLYQF